MPEDRSLHVKPVSPPPSFSLRAEWDTHVMLFQEVAGLDHEDQPTEFRRTANPVFGKLKLRGIQKLGNVTLKKGLLPSNSPLWTHFRDNDHNTIKQAPAIITFLNQQGAPLLVWTLANAWPVQMIATDFAAEENEIIVKTLEFAHEGITVTTP